MKPSVLIIGGSHFAGRVLVEEMINADDFQLFVLNRGNRPLNLEGVIELRADRNDPEALRRVLPDKHWAGVIDFCAYTPGEVEALLSILGPQSADHYILISTISVYRENPALPLVETAPLLAAPQPGHGPEAGYGFDKGRAEAVVKTMCRAAGIAWTVLRPAMIYGRYNYKPRERYFFDRINKKEPVIIPENNLALFQFVLVDDLARIVQFCLKDEFSRNTHFNVAAPDLISYARYVAVLEAVTGERIPVMPTPVEEIKAKHITLPFPADRHMIVSTENLTRTLGIEYTGFTEGMRKTWEWFKAQA